MPINYTYVAPITLGFVPDDGDLIGGTVNGVEVNGQWIGAARYARLYRVGNRDVPLCAIGFRGEKATVLVRQDSAPTTDYELHLYRYVPSGIVQIPQEYVEGIDGYGIIINSSTPDSTKKFKITVDDSGTISATEVT